MNIFVLDLDPLKAAEYQLNKHVVKMPLETAQILCTVAHAHGVPAPYRPTHRHHPCVVWAGESRQNAEWLLQHGLALCLEYSFRYGRTHACERVLQDLLAAGLTHCLSDSGQTPFAQAMPERYRDVDPVVAYRRYYAGEKREIAEWTVRNPPEWWSGEYYA